jgi:hypothetical protein
MERDTMKTTQLGRSVTLRLGLYLGAMLLVGLVMGFALPLASASAGVVASPAPVTGSQPVILVGNKNNNNKNNNKNWNNKNWNNKNVVVVRPYRHWNKRNYYGTVIGGVALGTILGAGAYSAVAPAPNLCWYWADPTMTQGYWDYC